MACDLRVVLPNRPGALVSACEAVAAAGINVDAICGDLRPGETWGYLHLLVDDGTGARKVLEEAGFEVTSDHHVDIVEIEDRPGELVKAFRKFSERGENLEVVYLAGDTRVVIGSENMRPDMPGVKMTDAKY